VCAEGLIPANGLPFVRLAPNIARPRTAARLGARIAKAPRISHRVVLKRIVGSALRRDSGRPQNGARLLDCKTPIDNK